VRVASAEVVKHALSGVLRRYPADSLHVGQRSVCSRTFAQTVVAVSLACALRAAILAFGLHVNLSASARRGLYQR
jgi:hypothetical protein